MLIHYTVTITELQSHVTYSARAQIKLSSTPLFSQGGVEKCCHRPINILTFCVLPCTKNDALSMSNLYPCGIYAEYKCNLLST